MRRWKKAVVLVALVALGPGHAIGQPAGDGPKRTAPEDGPKKPLPDTVSGEACYFYGDRETLNAARFVAISLAKRDSLERYSVFMEATVNVRGAELKNRIVTVVSGRAMREVVVADKGENPGERTVCRGIEARVEPAEVKALIAAVVGADKFRNAPPATGLPENENVRVIKVEEVSCPYDNETSCLRVVAECRRNTFGSRQPLRVIWYDPQGAPTYSTRERVRCRAARDIHNVWIRLPPQGYAFQLDLPRD